MRAFFQLCCCHSKSQLQCGTVHMVVYRVRDHSENDFAENARGKCLSGSPRGVMCVPPQFWHSSIFVSFVSFSPPVSQVSSASLPFLIRGASELFPPRPVTVIVSS